MNKIYHSIWNELTGTFVAVAEIAKSRGKRVGSKAAGANAWGALFGLTPLAAGLMAAGLAQAAPPVPTQLPTGGNVVAGQASISQANAVMTVNQTSNRAVLDWTTFNIGSSAAVNFVQPSASSATLNRVNDANPSQILGRINANGQVFLTNASGIYFGKDATVNVGALTASTHSIGNADFMAGNLSFSRNGAIGSVVNDGHINTALGGYIALLAPEVRNNGVVVAQMGTVALAAGETYELQFDGARLANVRVDPATMAALVENKQAVQAPGGLIILSAQAANRLQGGVVNNSGSLEATGLTDNGGTIRLSASDKISHTGSIHADAAANSSGNGGSVTVIADLANKDSVTEVNGTISARAGNQGGNGGFVETSAGKVQIGGNTYVDTRAPQGKTGEWLIDPVDYTVTAGAAWGSTSETTGWSLSDSLSRTDMTISATNNININDTVWWNVNKLTLSAGNDVNVNSLMTMAGTSTLNITTGASGKLNMGFDTGGTFKGRIDLPGRSGIFLADGTTPIFQVNGDNYTVINTALDLQNLNTSSTTRAGRYVLGTDIDASAIANWVPIGDSTNKFTGVLNGLGHSVANLTISRASTDDVGLFGYVTSLNATAYNTPRISNLGLTNSTVTGQNAVGVLAGTMDSAQASHVFASGSVSGVAGVGGLLGRLIGNSALENAHANVATTASGNNAGGLIGFVDGSTVTNAFANGAVATALKNAGGLVGYGQGTSTLNNVYATGNVTSTRTFFGGNVGGLMGYGKDNVNVSNAYATGHVSTLNGWGSAVGGLIGGFYGTGSVRNAYATGNVAGDTAGSTTSISGMGGLIGNDFSSGTVANVFATGNVSGADVVNSGGGGLIGNLGNGSVQNGYATGSVNGTSLGVTLYRDGNNTNWTAPASAGAIGILSQGTSASNISNIGYAQPTLTTNTWTGTASDGLWTTANNWSAGHAPTVLEKADIGTNAVSIAQIVIAGDVTASAGSQMNFTGNAVSSLSLGKTGTVTLGSAANDVAIDYGSSGKLNVPLASTLNLNGTSYTVINALGSFGSTTGTDLQGMNGNLSGAYVLGMDIDASDTVNWNSGKGFAPIAPTTIQLDSRGRVTGAFDGTPFSGSLNGLGHSVIKLTINDSTLNNAGLLGYVVGGDGISNVGVVDASISAKANVGGLIGYVSQGASYVPLSNLWASGGVSAVKFTKYNYTSFTNVGGLVGYANGVNVSNAHANAVVAGQDKHIGGLIGLLENSSALNNAYATGPVSGVNMLGGLVGDIDSSSASHVYATGAITGGAGNSSLGGLVGSVYYSTITHGTATGTVTGIDAVGGLIGTLTGGASDGAPSIQYVRASGDVNASGTNVGGLVGGMQGSGIESAKATGNVTGSYGSTTMGQIGGLIGNLSGSGYGVYNSTAFGNVSAPNASAVGGLVGLSINSSINGFAAGAVTGQNHVGGLIGYLDGGGSLNSPIQGSNDYVQVSGNDNVGGVIGTVSGASGAVFVGGGSFSNANVNGHSNVGGLIGQVMGSTNGANIRKSYSPAYQTVTATGDNVGGLIGKVVSNVAIDQVFASSTVNGDATNSHYVGGLIGHWQGDGSGASNALTNAYADGAVTGADKVGGLIGEIDVNTAGSTATVAHVYARGAVTTTGAAGGLLASKIGSGTATVTDAYWDTQTTGQTTSVDGAGKTTTRMQAKANYANFDFSDVNHTGVWRILSSANNSYPELCFFTGSCSSDNGSGISSTAIYLRLISGSSIYGNTPTLTYALYSAATGGTVIADANATGSVVWSTPLTATSNANTYAETYTGGITLGNSAYTLSAGSAVNWVISPRPLNVSVTKVYDGNANYSAAYVFTGMVNGNAAPRVSSGAAAVSSKNVGNYTSFASNTLVLSDGNYTLVGGGVSADITAKALTVSGTTVANKTYDGNTTAALSGGALQGVVSGDTVTLTQAGSFANKNAGTGKSVTAADTISGNDAGNYTLTQPTGLSADITAKALTVSGTTVANKTYDGNTTATLSGGALQGVVSGDAVVLTEAGSFANKNAGTGKTVTAADSISGTDAGNYSLTQPTGLSADIAPKAVVVAGLSVFDKAYDGSTNVVVGDWGSLTGMVGSETLVLGHGSAAFSDANAGAGKTVTASGYSLADGNQGGLASNYQLAASTATTTATIAALAPPTPVPTAPALPVAAAPIAAAPVTGASVTAPAASPSVQASNTATADVRLSSNITVSVVRSPSVQQTGVIAVSLPKDMASAGAGFSFPLPAQTQEAAPQAAVRVTLQNGNALPAWLKFNPESKTFSASAVPEGAFPIQLLVHVGGTTTTIEISERAQ